MRAGQLRHRVVIQEPVTDRDAQGGITVLYWSDKKTVWASIEPLKGRQFMEGKRPTSDITHLVRMRYFDQLTTLHRLLYDDLYILHIVAILNPQRRSRELELLCKELWPY